MKSKNEEKNGDCVGSPETVKGYDSYSVEEYLEKQNEELKQELDSLLCFKADIRIQRKNEFRALFNALADEDKYDVLRMISKMKDSLIIDISKSS